MMRVARWIWLGRGISAGVHASTDGVERDWPKGPVLCGSWHGDGSYADAADHRDQNHFRHLLVPSRFLRDKYRHVWPDWRRCLCLFVQGEVPTRATVLRSYRGNAGLRVNHQSRYPHAIDPGNRGLSIAHLSRGMGRIR